VADRPPVSVGVRTDVGRVRRLDEDSLGTPAVTQVDPSLLERRGRLCAVAGGMGGHTAGDAASQKTISTLFREY